MIKVTLPNGLVIEGDAAELVDLLAPVIAPQAPKPVAVIEPEPKLPASPIYPHRVSNTNCGLKIGAREEQVLRAAKMIAEVNESRTTEFTSEEITQLVEAAPSTISSALTGLSKKGLVAHGAHRKLWIVTRKGWDSKFWVTQPIRAGK